MHNIGAPEESERESGRKFNCGWKLPRSVKWNERPDSRSLCVHAKSLQSCPYFCDPMDYSPPWSSVHRTLQARILEWAAVLSSRDLPDPGIKPSSLTSPSLGGGFFTTNTTWEALKKPNTAAAKSLQSCLTLWDPRDGSPPGSSVHGIFQARVLEWVAIAFSQETQ